MMHLLVMFLQAGLNEVADSLSKHAAIVPAMVFGLYIQIATLQVKVNKMWESFGKENKRRKG